MVNSPRKMRSSPIPPKMSRKNPVNTGTITPTPLPSEKRLAVSNMNHPAPTKTAPNTIIIKPAYPSLPRG